MPTCAAPMRTLLTKFLSINKGMLLQSAHIFVLGHFFGILSLGLPGIHINLFQMYLLKILRNKPFMLSHHIP
jgi:TctA family transporter